MSQHPAVQSLMYSLKSPTNLAHSSLLVGPRRKQTDRGQRSAFPSETSRFAPCSLVSRRGFSRLTPRVAPPIFRSRSESGAYSQAPLLPPAFRGGTPVLVPWPLVPTVWLGFNWQCTANDIGYAVSWSQHALTPYRHSLLLSTVWVHPGGEAAKESVPYDK